MNKIETKLLLCLSDPELSDSDFKQFIDFLYRHDFKEIIPAADHLRRVSRDVLKSISRSRVSNDFAKYIQSILIQEGGMKPTEAVRSMLAELRDAPVPNRKWTVRAGLDFALRFASESDTIAAAQRAVAKHSSSVSKHAWSLKKPAD